MKNSRNWAVFFIAYLSITADLIWSQSQKEPLKKVILLPFQNIEHNQNAQYLESSLTDAVRDYMKTRLAFEDTSLIDVYRFAGENFYFRDDFYTATSQIHLGLQMQKDVVIGGQFQLYEGKEGISFLKTTVRILDIGKKKILKEFTIDKPADNRIFDSITEISKIIVKESSAILPNKDEYEKREYHRIHGYNLLSVAAGFDYFSVPNAVIPFQIVYIRKGIFWDRLSLMAEVEFLLGPQQEFQMNLVDTKVDMWGLSTTLAPGIHLFNLGKISFDVYLGGGFSYMSYNMSYQYTQTGTGIESTSSTEVYAPFVYTSALISIELITKFLYLDIKPAYKLLFYPGVDSEPTTIGMPGFEVGVSIYL